jgi:hypothetical protein
VLLLLLALLGWLVLTPLGATAVDRGEAPRPALTLLRQAPLELRGSEFSPGERVRVSLSARPVHESRDVVASASGTFRVRFDPLLAVEFCRGTLVVTAVGADGSRAIYERACRTPDPVLPSSAP